MGEINKIRRTSFIPRTDAQLLHKEPLFVFLMGPRGEEVANPIAQGVKPKPNTTALASVRYKSGHSN